MFKKILILSVLGFWLSVLGSYADEQLTITTYYPSPYGSYKELQLSPNDSQSTCNNNNRGAVYYDDSENQMKVCNGTTWQALGGDGIGESVLYTRSTCPNGWTNAGWFASSGADHYVCYRTDAQCQVLYSRSSCPSGWTNAGWFASGGVDNYACYRCS